MGIVVKAIPIFIIEQHGSELKLSIWAVSQSDQF